MACDDGLVMTLHPGVSPVNHHRPTHEQYGSDVGADIPIRVEFTEALRPTLNRYGTHPNFQLIIFTLDETTFSTEIGPLAGFYPSVYAGAPWWFIDAPEAIRRYRSAVTESAGFGKTSGFIDDTRAFCSIPARHDMSRRLDAGFVAQLVAEGASTRMRRSRPCTTWSSPIRGRRSSYDQSPLGPRLSRSLPDTPPAPPVRIVHLGLGNFHRAHQAWYTARATDAAEWGIAAFTGRRADAAEALAPQDGLYTLITRQVDGDEFEVIGSVAAVHAVDRAPDLPRLPRSSRGHHDHHHGHRGRLPARGGRAPRRRLRTLRRRGPDRGRDRAGGLAARQAGRRTSRPAAQRRRTDHDPVV